MRASTDGGGGGGGGGQQGTATGGRTSVSGVGGGGGGDDVPSLGHHLKSLMRAGSPALSQFTDLVGAPILLNPKP